MGHGAVCASALYLSFSIFSYQARDGGLRGRAPRSREVEVGVAGEDEVRACFLSFFEHAVASRGGPDGSGVWAEGC